MVIVSRLDAWRESRDRGSSAIEAAIITPLLVVLLCLFVAASRLAVAGQRADAAAQDAARAASISRSAATAPGAARAAAHESLSAQGQACVRSSVDADTGGLSVPLGQAASVTVTVTCTVPLGDLLLPGAGGPGTYTVRSTFTSVVDRFRERS
ncbi:TadE/TadG family type IV pilus assembly protein [Streptomyces sp. NPDC050161]|uniref:TadE/TadG family type IV pilus assembly protein n=1 Tax=Streptomyces sp. NPDC050161 TaxID=3365604 RepID=UPI0037A3C74D